MIRASRRRQTAGGWRQSPRCLWPPVDSGKHKQINWPKVREAIWELATLCTGEEEGRVDRGTRNKRFYGRHKSEVIYRERDWGETGLNRTVGQKWQRGLILIWIFLMLRKVLRGRFIGRKQAKVHKKATVRQLGQSGAPSANFPLIVMKKMEPSVIFQRIGQDERVVEEPWLKVDPCLCISWFSVNIGCHSCHS